MLAPVICTRELVCVAVAVTVLIEAPVVREAVSEPLIVTAMLSGIVKVTPPAPVKVAEYVAPGCEALKAV